jgi:serine/threonine-protein kinase
MAFAALSHGDLARIGLARGDNTRSLAESKEAVEMFDHVSGFRDVRMGPYLWLIRSDVLRSTGDFSGARSWAQRALEASRRYDDPAAASIVEALSALRLATANRIS